MPTIREVMSQLTSGAITFTEALADFRAMPTPVQPARPNNWADVYERAEAWPGDNDYFWVESAVFSREVTMGERARIFEAILA
jgi:hypothetical protein